MSPSPRLFAILGLLLLPLGVWWALDSRQTTRIRVAAVSRTDAQSENQRERVFRETFDIRSGGLLSVDVVDADVEVRSGSAGAVVVEAWVSARDMDWGREVFRRSEFTASVEGQTVYVEADNPNIESWEWRENRGAGVTTIITVPTDFNVKAITGDGDIQIASLRGNVEARTSDGDVSIENIEGEHVTIDTSDGDVRVVSLAGRNVRIETSDGDIDVRSLRGPLEARTSDGDITIRLEGTNDDISLGTGDGDINIFAPTTLRAEVSLEGEDVEIARGFQLLGTMRSRAMRGTLNGGGPRISARTGDGEISLRSIGR